MSYIYIYVWHGYFLLKLTSALVIGVCLLKTLKIYYILLTPCFFIMKVLRDIRYKKCIINYTDLVYYTNPWYPLYITVLLPYYSWSKIISKLFYRLCGKKYPVNFSWKYFSIMYLVNVLIGIPAFWLYLWGSCVYLFIFTPGQSLREGYDRYFRGLFTPYVTDYAQLVIPLPRINGTGK